MELKSQVLEELQDRAARSNRTFMELKLIINFYMNQQHQF